MPSVIVPLDGSPRAALMARSKREIPRYYLSNTIDLEGAIRWLEARNAARSVSARVLPVDRTGAARCRHDGSRHLDAGVARSGESRAHAHVARIAQVLAQIAPEIDLMTPVPIFRRSSI